MKRIFALAMAFLVVPQLLAQSANGEGVRAWQERLSIEVPLKIPSATALPTNPFFKRVDKSPERAQAMAPRKLDVSGQAIIAILVDANGRVAGSVPIELPFPGISQSLAADIAQTNFNAGRLNNAPTASWVVMGIDIFTRIKTVAFSDERISFPDPDYADQPQRAGVPKIVGRLALVDAVASNLVGIPATPRRVRVRLSPISTKVPIRAMVHVSTSGRIDRWVPVDMPSGLKNLMESYLGSWRIKPALDNGQPAAIWMVYEGVAAIETSGLDSEVARQIKTITFPAAAASTEPSAD